MLPKICTVSYPEIHNSLVQMTTELTVYIGIMSLLLGRPFKLIGGQLDHCVYRPTYSAIILVFNEGEHDKVLERFDDYSSYL